MACGADVSGGRDSLGRSKTDTPKEEPEWIYAVFLKS
jgi:hypothetical protein